MPYDPHSIVTQPVEPSTRATSSTTRQKVRGSASAPPNARGTKSLKNPASIKLRTTGSGRRRPVSICPA